MSPTIMTENSLESSLLPNLPEFSVSELSSLLKRALEDRFEHVRVRGEISGFKRHTSGHLYLSLKDANAVLDAVCWRGTAARLGLKPEDGMEVVCAGRITTYPGRSKYQLVVETMELAGEGALLKLLEDRKRKLAAEGLFDAARKKPLPYLPEVIGVVTSPTGAVIRDILHRLADRFPRRVILWPVAVQGSGAAEQVAGAIEGFNRLQSGGTIPRPDLLIVARGGGSLEDLWAFNEEIVVRAAAASAIPLISAVGHETDTTLIDFASDRRAPTPTAAAEIAVPVRGELLAQTMENGQRLVRAWNRMVEERRSRLEGLARGLPDPVRLLEQASQRFDDWSERFMNAATGFVARRQERLGSLPDLARTLKQLIKAKEQEFSASAARLRKAQLLAEIERQGRETDRLALRLRPATVRLLDRVAERIDGLGKRLDNLSYRRVLDRGYALVRDSTGGSVTAAAATSAGMAVSIEFHDGVAGAVIGKMEPRRSETGTRRETNPSHSGAKDKVKSKQGSLL